MKYKLVVGLGNPGPEYEHTYHNAGALALEAAKDEFEKMHGGRIPFSKYKNRFEYARVGEMLFARPLAFMNESGAAVREAARMAKAGPEEIFVMHDDSDLAVGSLKVEAGRNAAGHHGVESIIEALGSKEFTRARIGIRPEREAVRRKAADIVLKTISKKDGEALQRVFAAIAERIGLVTA